jgi:hypothetical protein
MERVEGATSHRTIGLLKRLINSAIVGGAFGFLTLIQVLEGPERYAITAPLRKNDDQIIKHFEPAALN